MNTSTVSSTQTSTKKRIIKIADWLYWQWRYEQEQAKQAALFHCTSGFQSNAQTSGKAG